MSKKHSSNFFRAYVALPKAEPGQQSRAPEGLSDFPSNDRKAVSSITVKLIVADNKVPSQVGPLTSLALERDAGGYAAQFDVEDETR